MSRPLSTTMKLGTTLCVSTLETGIIIFEKIQEALLQSSSMKSHVPAVTYPCPDNKLINSEIT